MPFYTYQCPAGHQFESFLTIVNHVDHWPCRHCSSRARQVITAPMLVKASSDVCYDSPIDGRAITSRDAHREDLKRNDCLAYDPEMKRDSVRRQQESERALEQDLSSSVEEFVEKLPTARRGQLMSEMTAQGMEIVCQRP